ncbi:MAG TPA: ABC transporter permease [Candidatus Angelobacter sp.]|nr:ABC transporter permease [Candidatus Angelobacter sp.]
MRGFRDDLRFAFRLVRKKPIAALSVITVLALGIGANTAIFNIVDCVLIRPLPYSNPGQLALLWETEPELRTAPVTGPDYEDWKQMVHSFQSIAAGTEAMFNMTGSGEPLRLEGFSVTPKMFDLLGVQPSLGRTFQVGEDQNGHERVAILSYGLWQRGFGGDRGVIGREIVLDGKNYAVVGVMPAQFRFPELWGIQPELFVPLVIGQEPWQTTRGNHWLFVVGRLKAGVTVAQADAELRNVAGNLEKAYPDSNARINARVVSLREQLTGRTRPTLVVLLIAVGFILAICCANVANLALGQAVLRYREVAIRLALGARVGRIVRQRLTESLLLSVLGALLGLLIAYALERALLVLGPPGYVPSIANVHFNSDVFLFAAFLAIVTGLLSGSVPAWHSSRAQVNDTLKERGSFPTKAGGGFRDALIVAEVASALILLFGAGLTIQSLRRTLHLDLGFNPEHVLTMKLSLPDQSYPDDEHVAHFYNAALERIRAIPGVEAAGAVSELPFEGGNNGFVVIEGQPVSKAGFSGPLVENAKATPGYFRAIQIPVIAGRDFTDADSPRVVAIINQAMARRFWPDQEPIGKRFSRDRDQPKWIEVIGVVADTREFGLESPAIPQSFLLQRPGDARAAMNLVVRTALPPESAPRQVITAVHQIDKQLPVYRVTSMDEIVSRQSGVRRFNVFLLGLFAGLALLLASVGIYGVMSYLVSQRTQEIGVRIALGATRSAVLQLVLGHSMKLIVTGLICGIVVALGSGRFLASLVFQVKPDDPAIIALITLLLGAVGLVASYIPAHRATLVDPVVALRQE